MDQLKYKCPFCHFRSRSIANLNGHINDFHINLKDHSCKYCDFVGKDFENAKYHVQTNHTKLNNNKNFRCKKVLQRAINLGPHTKLLISRNPNSVSQPLISIVPKTSKDNLEEQSCRSKTKKDKSFQCQYCDYSTCLFNSFEKHIKFRHTRATLYKCQYCEYKVTQFSRLEGHINSKHTKTGLQQCQYCAYETTLLNNLKRHIKTMHTKRELFKCPLCDLETTHAYNLKRHNERKHEQKSFKCENCDYVTKKEEEFRQHIMKEHESDPTEATLEESKVINNVDYSLFKEEKFIDDVNHEYLHVHNNSQHLDGTDKTELDSRELFQSSDLERHIKHENFQKSFECQFCDYESIEVVEWRKHMTTKHPNMNESVLNEIKVEEESTCLDSLVKDEPDLVECHCVKQILDEVEVKPEDLQLNELVKVEEVTGSTM